MFLWWLILFLCPDIIKKVKEKKNEVEKDIEQNVIEEELMKTTYLN